MKERYVRVKPKSGAKSFHRCGMLFTLAWALVTVDEATAARLDEEQMLEVSEDMPVDYEGLDATSNADGTANAEPPTTAATPAAAPHTPPVPSADVGADTASPVAMATGVDAGEVAQASSLQAQAEAEARAQADAEAAAEAAPVASASRRPTAKAKK